MKRCDGQCPDPFSSPVISCVWPSPAFGSNYRSARLRGKSARGNGPSDERLSETPFRMLLKLQGPLALRGLWYRLNDGH